MQDRAPAFAQGPHVSKGLGALQRAESECAFGQCQVLDRVSRDHQVRPSVRTTLMQLSGGVEVPGAVPEGRRQARAGAQSVSESIHGGIALRARGEIAQYGHVAALRPRVEPLGEGFGHRGVIGS